MRGGVSGRVVDAACAAFPATSPPESDDDAETGGLVTRRGGVPALVAEVDTVAAAVARAACGSGGSAHRCARYCKSGPSCVSMELEAAPLTLLLFRADLELESATSFATSVAFAPPHERDVSGRVVDAACVAFLATSPPESDDDAETGGLVTRRGGVPALVVAATVAVAETCFVRGGVSVLVDTEAIAE